MNVSSWLKRTATSSSVARLDVELILAQALGKDRVFLYAHPDYELSEAEEQNAQKMLSRRVNHEALAYITGKKEFYGREFSVSPDVLIPRPESEAIVNLAKEISPKPLKILDVGTGSGCLAITLKLEIPEAEVTALDISPKALEVAKNNARALGAEVDFCRSDLFSGVEGRKFDLIVANLPYVDKNWDWLSPELKYEPDLALYAENGGLELIQKLIDQASAYLLNDGNLILESDLSQHDSIEQYARQNAQFELQESLGLAQIFCKKSQKLTDESAKA